MLKIERLEAGYGAMQVLHGIDLTVRPGQLVALLGGNGAGKSTTLNTIAGLHRASAGTVSLGDRTITGLAAETVFGAGIALVPQGRHLFPEMTVLENLLLGCSSQRLPAGEASGRLDAVFAWFPRLRERESQRAASLSGGEQQMLATGRALMSKPQLLLLDEPTTGLAPLVVAEMGRLCVGLRERGQTILLIEQNIEMALAIADYVYVLRGGRIVLHGEPKTLAAEQTDIFRTYIGL